MQLHKGYINLEHKGMVTIYYTYLRACRSTPRRDYCWKQINYFLTSVFWGFQHPCKTSSSLAAVALV